MGSLAPYGPWAIAFGLVLYALKDIVKDLVGHAFKRPAIAEGGGDVTRELARAVDKLSAVLERMERAQERMEMAQEKRMDAILENQRRMAETLSRLDYRTSEQYALTLGGANAGAEK